MLNNSTPMATRKHSKRRRRHADGRCYCSYVQRQTHSAGTRPTIQPGRPRHHGHRHRCPNNISQNDTQQLLLHYATKGEKQETKQMSRIAGQLMCGGVYGWSDHHVGQPHYPCQIRTPENSKKHSPQAGQTKRGPTKIREKIARGTAHNNNARFNIIKVRAYTAG